MNKDIFKPLMVLLIVVSFGSAGFFWTKNSLLKEETPRQAVQVKVSPTVQPTPAGKKTLGEFLVLDREVCLENGKPVVYFFGSSQCPHCVWEKPIIKKVADKFKNEISYHENYDSDKDAEVFKSYSNINPGYVPFLALGCRYARVGAGENLGSTPEESKRLEEEALTVIICKLTNNKPGSICTPLKEKIDFL